MQSFPKGISLLETVLYIGMLSVVLPTYIVFMLHIWQQQIGLNARTNLEQTSSLLFLELSSAITASDAILVSESTFDSDQSVLKFNDSDGNSVVIDVAMDDITFSNINQSVQRLRLQNGDGSQVWITAPEINVKQWMVSAIRNNDGILTGIRVGWDAEFINSSNKPYRDATFTANTVFAVSPQTTEI